MFYCSECNAVVNVDGPDFVRTCGHDTAAIVAEMTAVATGEGGIEE